MSKRNPHRGNYRRSQEADAYNHRSNTAEKMQRFIDMNGVVRFGRHNGTHITKLPKEYISWACSTIAGFNQSYALHLKSHAKQP
jgi:hypothetical protein